MKTQTRKPRKTITTLRRENAGSKTGFPLGVPESCISFRTCNRRRGAFLSENATGAGGRGAGGRGSTGRGGTAPSSEDFLKEVQLSGTPSGKFSRRKNCNGYPGYPGFPCLRFHDVKYFENIIFREVDLKR